MSDLLDKVAAGLLADILAYNDLVNQLTQGDDRYIINDEIDKEL